MYPAPDRQQKYLNLFIEKLRHESIEKFKFNFEQQIIKFNYECDETKTSLSVSIYVKNNLKGINHLADLINLPIDYYDIDYLMITMNDKSIRFLPKIRMLDFINLFRVKYSELYKNDEEQFVVDYIKNFINES